VYDQGRPLFLFHQVAEEMGVDVNLITVANSEKPTFLLQETERGAAIGVHPSKVIKQPFLCLVKHGIAGLIGGTIALVGTICVILGSWLLEAFQHSPTGTLAALLLGFATLSIARIAHRKRTNQRKLELNVINMRERVYVELSKDVGKAVSADVVCHRIVWEMYPINRAERDRLSAKIWPLVVRDINSDSRVQKTWGTSDGRKELLWKWVDQPIEASAGRDRVRF
jgi:hypothetical protein